jgi:hypothetical protein
VNSALTTVCARRMAHGMTRKPEPLGGGIFIVLGLFGGIFAGRAYGQISFGLLAGLGAGIAIALAIWLFQRRR